MMLSVSGLTKVFDQQPVFSGFDLTVTRNRFAVLIGPSGCGKSTFFDVLTGVTSANEGELSWQGTNVDHLGNITAYMHQKDLLLPWFTLFENSLLPAKTAGENLQKARGRATQLFSRLGLDGYETHLPHQVSGGMRQRCALVRTLMFNRDLILLDEPLSALDAITRKSLQSLLLLLQSEFNRTMVMITHDVDEALLLADDLYLLSAKPMRIVEKIVLHGDKPRRFDNPELLTMKNTIMQKLEGDIDHVSC
jgi:putative hydroxymethylpyrimidine transport system ATP-binding protein